MTAIEKDKKAFEEALSTLALRFPVAEITKRTGFAKGNVSRFLTGRQELSRKFLLKFYEVFGDDLKAAGLNPLNPGSSNLLGTSEDYQAKYIALLEQQLAQANENLAKVTEAAKKQAEIIEGSLKELLRRK